MPFNQQMGFPCELTLRRVPEGLRLFREPVREIAFLRTNTQEWSDKVLAPNQNLIAAESGDLFDIRADIDLGQASRIGIKIRGESLEYSVTDRRLSCLGQSAPLDLIKDSLQLQILVDRSSLEVFANGGRISMSTCFLPRQRENPIELSAQGGPANIRKLTVHSLRSIWR